MIPYKKDITIRFGDTSVIFFRVYQRAWNPVTSQFQRGDPRDLTGYTISAQIRVNQDSTGVLATYTTTLGNQANADTKGTATLTLSASATEALRAVSPQPTVGVYDVQFTTPSGEVYTYIEGNVTFKKDVTRS